MDVVFVGGEKRCCGWETLEVAVKKRLNLWEDVGMWIEIMIEPGESLEMILTF